MVREEKAQEEHGHFGLSSCKDKGNFLVENHYLALAMQGICDQDISAAEDFSFIPLLPREYTCLLSTKHFLF